jgi:hypothetical protein
MVQWFSFIPRDALDPDTCSSLFSLPQPSILCSRDHRFADCHGFLDQGIPNLVDFACVDGALIMDM